MYTAQMDAHGNIIVCKGGDIPRTGYAIFFIGSYQTCQRVKGMP